MMKYLTTDQPERIAYVKTDGRDDLPGVIFCGGFMSDMSGSKASELETLCAARGQSYVRFDYSGHGRSEGRFIDGTIGRWFTDTLAVFDNVTSGPQIVVGSSMGGWMALLLGLKRRDRVKGIVGIAAAPDFVTEIFEKEFNDTQRRELEEKGLTHLPSGYEHPYPISQALVADGKLHRLLHQPINITCPVRLIQGTKDEAVAADKPERIKGQLVTDDVEIIMVEGGNHSLSRPEDIALIDSKIRELSE